MSRDFILPDLGEGLTEASIVAWLVAPGEEISIDQPVVEVESAKSVVQLPSPFGGTVERLGGEVGDVLNAGQVLLSVSGSAIAEPETTDAAVQTPARATPSATGAPAAGASADTSQSAEGSGAVLIGYGTRETTRSGRTGGRRFGRGGGAVSPATAGAAGTGPMSTGPSRPPASRAATDRLDPTRRSPVISPIVRRIARENGFDASQLLGSGPDHLVMRRDVEEYIREAVAQPEAAPAASVTAIGDTREPLDRMRTTAAEHFSRSRREIPEATIWLDVDATPLLAAKRELESATGERFGVTALIARFVVAGLRRNPVLNASFDAERSEIVHHGAINLGLAAQTPRGLLVPVVHGAESMTLRQLRDGVGERVDQAKTGAFPAGALSGGTFTLNNFGSLGVDGSAAIINHPEVGILGLGRMKERPWVVDGELAVRTVMELSFVFDHRVCDGATAADFLSYVAGCIERPISLLADL